MIHFKPQIIITVLILFFIQDGVIGRLYTKLYYIVLTKYFKNIVKFCDEYYYIIYYSHDIMFISVSGAGKYFTKILIPPKTFQPIDLKLGLMIARYFCYTIVINVTTFNFFPSPEDNSYYILNIQYSNKYYFQKKKKMRFFIRVTGDFFTMI